MDDTTQKILTRSRWRSNLLRWAVCTALISSVFVAARLTADHQEHPSTLDSSSGRWLPPPSLSEASGEGSGETDPLAGFDDLLEEALPPTRGNGPNLEDGALGDEEVIEQDDDGFATVTRSGRNGESWQITYPASWEVGERHGGAMTTLTAPESKDLVGVSTWPRTDSLPNEATAWLDALPLYLTDPVVDTVDRTEVNGREAIQADFEYTSAGDQLAATLIWIEHGDSIYVLYGETGIDQVDLRDAVNKTLASFAISDEA